MSEPRLCIAAPLGVEARALRRGGPHVHVVRTGAGPARARQACPRLSADPAPALAVAGVGGALEPGLRPGTVFVADSLRAKGLPPRALMAEPVAQALRRHGLSVACGALLSSDHIVRGSERTRLAAKGVRAVDMESAWLAPAAGPRPLAVVRVVVDAPGHELLRPGILRAGLRALRSLRDLVPALEEWAEQVARIETWKSPARAHEKE